MFNDGRTYVLGEQPCIADFALYQGLWFLEQLPNKILSSVTNRTELLKRMRRVAAFGHHQHTELSSTAVLAIAHEIEPLPTRFISSGRYHNGAQVSIQPVEHTSPAVFGTLIGIDEDRITLRREEPTVGIVHVHFPRFGYQLKII